MAELPEITKPTAFPSQETQVWNTQYLPGIKFPRDSILYAVGGEFEVRNSSQDTELEVGSITFKGKDKIKTYLKKVNSVVEFEKGGYAMKYTRNIACIELRTFMRAGIMVQ